MANVIKQQKIIDNSKRALIKLVIVSDGSAEANTRVVDVSMLQNALNANGYIMSGNTDPKSQYRTAIKRIFGQAKIGGYARLQWDGGANDEIVTISTGAFNYDFESMGDVAVIKFTDSANSTGDILLSTNGLTANDAFTVFIDLRKQGEDYDQGQTADPMAFNKGSRALS